MTVCCVPHCGNKSDNGYSMRHFPKNPTRRALWAKNINRKNWKPNDYSCICDVSTCLNINKKFVKDISAF